MEKYVKNLSEVKAVKPGVDVVILDGGALKCAKIADTMVYNTVNGWFVEYTTDDGTKYDNTVKFMVSEEDVNGANKLSRVGPGDLYRDADSNLGFNWGAISTQTNVINMFDEYGSSVEFKDYNLQLRENGRYYVVRTDNSKIALYSHRDTAHDATKIFNGKTAKELLTLTAEQRQAWEDLKRAIEECRQKNIKFLYTPDNAKLSPFNGDNFKWFSCDESDRTVNVKVISTLNYLESIDIYCNYEDTFCEFDVKYDND